MPLALVVAPSDPRAGDAASRRQALAWLRGELARQAFDIVIVSGGQDPRAVLEKVAPAINPGDVVLVHVSGRLVGSDSLAFGPNGAVAPLSLMAELFAARGAATLSYVAELTYDDSLPGQPTAREILSRVVDACATPERAYSVLAAVRPLGAVPFRFAFTRAGLGPRRSPNVPRPPESLLAHMHATALASPEGRDSATLFELARAGSRVREVVVSQESSLAPDLSESLVAPEAAQSRGGAAVAESMTPPPVMPATETDAEIARATELQDWRRAAELRTDRLNGLADPKAVVRELVVVARILQSELGDAHGAIGALERARGIDPTRPSVLRALRRGYEIVERWRDAIEVTGVLAQQAPNAAEQAALRVAQARMALDQLGDTATALSFVEGALAAEPQHTEALLLLGRLRGPEGGVEAEAGEVAGTFAPPVLAEEASLDDVERFAATSPLHAPVYSAAFQAYRRAGQADGALLAAMSLEELGAADVEQQALVAQFRSVGPVKARAPLDADGWQLLRAPGHDDVLAALFAAVEGAAVAQKLDELREARQLQSLDRSKRLSETSTASVVRSFQWAARFLDVRCPDLYVVEAAPGIAVMHAPDPSTALGLTVLSGPTAKELAFLAGRHLTYYRPEYHVLLYYPTREDLTLLLMAAVQLTMPESSSLPAPVRALRARLARRTGEAERDALIRATRALDARGGQARIGAWMRSVEMTAARAGLLLCGDLGTAMPIVRAESRPIADLSDAERRGDLVLFCASRAHATLRARFVVAGASESVAPPPPRTVAAQ